MRNAAVCKTLWLCLLLIAGSDACAQKAMIHGVVLDSIDGTPVEKATVTYQVKDSLVAKTITTDRGFFSFKQSPDSGMLLFEHLGYVTKQLRINQVIGKMPILYNVKTKTFSKRVQTPGSSKIIFM